MSIRKILALAALPGILFSAVEDYKRLWQPNGKPLPKPIPTLTLAVTELGKEVAGKEWQMVSTRYHQLYYQASADLQKVQAVYQVIDNLYDFLAEHGPAKAELPIQVYLIPGETGKPKCSVSNNGMRTGADGDAAAIVSSLLQEESHLFNAEFTGGEQQGWWGGSYSGLYFQERARLTTLGVDLRTPLSEKLPKGPRSPLVQLDVFGDEVYYEAISALYFFEEVYGAAKFKEFRKLSLRVPESSVGRTAASVFEKAFGKPLAEIEREWRAYYKWPEYSGPVAVPEPKSPEDKLQTKVSLSRDKASVQDVARQLAAQAGLKYNAEKSLRQADPECRRFVQVVLREKPFQEAMESMLKIVGLRFEMEDGAVVLYRK